MRFIIHPRGRDWESLQATSAVVSSSDALSPIPAALLIPPSAAAPPPPWSDAIARAIGRGRTATWEGCLFPLYIRPPSAPNRGLNDGVRVNGVEFIEGVFKRRERAAATPPTRVKDIVGRPTQVGGGPHRKEN